MRDKVLVVDDIDINRLILIEILGGDYEIVEAEDGASALRWLDTAGELPHAVLLDIMMPGLNGFEVLARIRENPRTMHIPVLFITAADARENESRGLTDGAVDYISKPFNPDVVKARVDNHIQLARYRDSLESMVEIKTYELMRMHEHILETLAAIIEYRSLESGDHVKRSSMLTAAIVKEMLRDQRYREQLYNERYMSIIKATSLHDIGKVGIPDNILLKPGYLTQEEFETIKTHTIIGSEIIDSIAEGANDDMLYLHHCRDICRSHHERWDGTGYPDKLKGEEIPLSARIVSVVDVYDALVNERCYKPRFPHEKAVQLIEENAGTQFDPNIVQFFLACEQRFRNLVMKPTGIGELSAYMQAAPC